MYRDHERLSSVNGCGKRSDFTWMISCWEGEFSYIDDSLLIMSTKESLYFSVLNSLLRSADVIDDQTGQLRLVGLESHFSGPHLIEVSIGDELVSGEPIPVDLTVGVGSSVVVPSLCLVNFKLSPTSAVVAGETLIQARVLLRDQAGNVVSNRPDVPVELVLNNTDTDTIQNVTCSYIEGKYYECYTYANDAGTTVITVVVDGQLASVTEGGIPSQPVCASASACGIISSCPCEQRRVPFSMTLQISLD
jgi:hypothetical protein